MKLCELLKVLPLDTLVGIWNIDSKHERCPTPQTYQKIKNLTWKKLRNVIDYDVLGAAVMRKTMAYLFGCTIKNV